MAAAGRDDEHDPARRPVQRRDAAEPLALADDVEALEPGVAAGGGRQVVHAGQHCSAAAD
ncbi:MAG TPA: hypothetical protein VFL60_03020 [Gaiellaceae bacterium]|nr:hypothetical protein [Gaiellaceae bacterium]